ncbi:iron uptake porin [Cyanobacterium aponinum]|uniref:Cyanobacterial porin n=1 Tax=Cyanobacterium aponinum (strain PCC 10605) TaxID=755178 RepID=K9Z147_CYAAP|nr:iron uptake porin [Cyanobacterium aponinum]AFZ52285.1 cyanobacterial porin [Cyanobacterium aponinum PCC 10605]
MFKLVKNYTIATPALIAMAIASNGLAPVSANANEVDTATIDQISQYNETQPMGQVTSVSQLRDVSPTDWAFEALRSLVERYGCIVGYPDRTYRGNRALSRYEFAAGLNACMQQMERLIASSESVLREDIEKLKRLMSEFEAELAALGARVDNLEGRVAFLEDHQFSTTTKLKGEVVIAAVGQGGGTDGLGLFNENYLTGAGERLRDLPADSIDDQFTLSNRVRLTLDTSFTGKDTLRTRLAAGNIVRLGNAFGSDMARLNFEQNTGNDIILDRVYYKTKLGDKTTFWVGTEMPIEDIYETFSPYTESSGTGALSRVNRFNPFIYRQPGSAGIGLKYAFNKNFDITASYLADNAADASQGNGLFNGTYSTGVQLGVHPTDTLSFGLAYVHSYFSQDDVNLTGSTGSRYTDGISSQIAALGSGNRDGGFAGTSDPFSGAATSSENVGLQATWRVAEKVNLAGWVGWSFAQAHSADSTGANRNGDNADLFTWNTNVSFLDLGKEGSVLTIAGGQVPRAGSVDGTIGRDRGQSWVVEGQYKYPLTDNISLTPGVYAVFNPNNSDDSRNQTVVVGVLRTVFKF